jgi:ribosome-associated toxin RatA of RatAB toxin-antitoxin module
MWRSAVLLGAFMPIAVSAASSLLVLNVAVDTAGVAHVRAVLDLPASPAVTYAVLTDYAKWPRLFPHGVRIVEIQQGRDGVTTDLYVRRHFFPGEFHLVTLTRELAPGTVQTSLIDGDFLQYQRTWTLTQGHGAGDTRAELAMDIQPKQWIPAWLFTIVLEHELREHFEKLRDEVRSRTLQ